MNIDNRGGVLKVLLVVFGLIILAVFGAGYYIFNTYFSSAPVTAGEVVVEEGGVFLNNLLSQSNQEVSEGDIVSTDSSGQATVVLYGAVKVRLNSNTEIVLTDMTQSHPRVEQRSGETWNEFVPVGAVTKYSITEGNNTAMVLGTVFRLNNGRITTAEGSVQYTSDGSNFTVSAGQVVESVNGSPVSRQASSEERSDILNHLLFAVDELRADRQVLLSQNQAFIDQIKSKFDITDEQIDEGLAQLDSGQLDLDELLDRLPFVPASVDRVANITSAIRQINQEIIQLQ